FFRLYNKLSGMTGTAMTEEAEFQEIYKLDVIEIPTNKPIARIDDNDAVYKTEKAKYNAVIERIIESNQKGQPVLVGTVTIEKSELLSSMLKKKGIQHNVLNAKHHEKEAEIIAQAGKFGAVTIATNMAGRGTDIMLGGNAEYLAKAQLRHDGLSEEIITEATGYAETADPDIINARAAYKKFYDKFKEEIAPEAEKVKQAGGLCIIGTERHDSRRIDNQLRGRAGRQGDPGITKFFISLEDDLMRLYGGERISTMMDTLRVDENTPLESGMLSRTIEGAQKKKEGMNFAIRKNVLQYDDVMNKQRELIYEQRNRVLDGDSIKDTVMKMIDDTIESYCKIYLSDPIADNWDINGLREYFLGWVTANDDLRFSTEELNRLKVEDVSDMLKEKAHENYAKREAEFGSETMREVERVMLLRSVDTNWMDHIDNMDQLRQGIGLRAYGQHDPVVEYRNDSYDMFSAMTDTIREQTAKLVLSVRVRKNEEVKREKVAEETGTGDKPQTVRGKGVVSKNALCPCGSGKKYKRCCGKDLD
ncbi:MAG: SEC-C domain-containing protein, partial [Clostridia bacterium]|nr:SEC-C domain-containing protein [Clostridia bacterium]